MPGMTGRLGSALIAPYYGSGSGGTCSSTDRPLPTVTTKARFGLVMPVTHGKSLPQAKAGGGNRVRDLEEPLPTVTGAHRGELACIVASWGERQGQAPRVHSVNEPTPTICATGRIQLAVAEPVVEGRQYDIRYRMLEPKELARAMGFSDAETAYEFAGNKTEITKQIGNAVPVNLAAALVGALMPS
jgi:DNA (cytosine-5)-methyltransferase 1